MKIESMYRIKYNQSERQHLRKCRKKQRWPIPKVSEGRMYTKRPVKCKPGMQSERDENKGRYLHKTSGLLMLQDLPFPAHTRLQHPSTCICSLPPVHSTLQLKITRHFHNLTNHFLLILKPKKVLIFVFFSGFDKKCLKPCVSFNFSED